MRTHDETQNQTNNPKGLHKPKLICGASLRTSVYDIARLNDFSYDTYNYILDVLPSRGKIFHEHG